MQHFKHLLLTALLFAAWNGVPCTANTNNDCTAAGAPHLNQAEKNIRLLWSTPIHVLTDAIVEETRSNLAKMALWLESQYYTKHRSNRGGWQSHNILNTDRESKDPFVGILLENIRTRAAAFLSTGGRKVDSKEVKVKSLWFNVNRENDHNVLHQHGDSLLSGVVYLLVAPPSHGAIVFIDPRPQAFSRSNYEDFFGMQRNHIIHPTERKMVLFPSFVPHRVERASVASEDNAGKNFQPRISASFNIILDDY